MNPFVLFKIDHNWANYINFARSDYNWLIRKSRLVNYVCTGIVCPNCLYRNVYLIINIIQYAVYWAVCLIRPIPPDILPRSFQDDNSLESVVCPCIPSSTTNWLRFSYSFLTSLASGQAYGRRWRIRRRASRTVNKQGFHVPPFHPSTINIFGLSFLYCSAIWIFSFEDLKILLEVRSCFRWRLFKGLCIQHLLVI